MPKTCLICCDESEYFLLPPCNHKQICWKCAATLVEGSTFSCPFCHGTPQGASCILFVNQSEMEQFTFQDILKRNPYKSASKSYQFYSNKDVANFIQQSTSNFCRLCYEVFSSLSTLKKHLNQAHHKQYCDICLQNRKCLFSQQELYSAIELTLHLKKGQSSSDGSVLLYHPLCSFCKTRYYDVHGLLAHIRMSAHMQCHICKQNYGQLKNVYYRDYYQIEQHFMKSHYVCQTGQCINKKLSNVYVSEYMLQQHQNRQHYSNKHGGKAGLPVTNLLLGFHAQKEEFQWDRIGKDFSEEFAAIQNFSELKNYQHNDGLIDIRAFYPQQTKSTEKMNLQSILNAYFEQQPQKKKLVSNEIHFNSVRLFCPLQMQNLTKLQLQKFIRNIYNYKFGERLIQTVFTKKYNFKTDQQYISQIQTLIKSHNTLSYYYVFPQLIRFMKDSNSTKETMDKLYGISLRQLKINKIFIFHKMQRYSDILNILQQQIENYIYNQMINEKINLKIYQTYLTDLNPTYYQSNHASIFYVQRQKMKNMYHMVKKTKTRQLLKLNWLLKLGLSNNSYKLIYDKFFYKTIDDCGQAMKAITLQEMALLYSYTSICLQAMINQQKFNEHKSNPPTFFLSSILQKIPTCIMNKQLILLKQIQNKSIQISIKLNNSNTHKKNHQFIVNQQDHPSLLSQQQQKKKNDKSDIIIFGRQCQSSSINNISIKKKKITNKMKQQKQQKQQKLQEFPRLFEQKKKQQIIIKNLQQQFPIYNFNQKTAKNYQNQIQKSNKKKNIKDNQQINAFNNDSTLKKEQKKQKNEKQIVKPIEIQKKATTMEQIKKSKKWEQLTKEYDDQMENKEIKNGENCLIILPKKKKQDQESDDNKNGRKKKKKKYLNKQTENASKEVNEQQKQEGSEKPKEKKQKIRADQASSSQQKRREMRERERQRQEKYKKFKQQQQYRQILRNKDEFPPLDNKQSQISIVNAVIEQNRKINIKQVNIKINKRNGKKQIKQKLQL